MLISIKVDIQTMKEGKERKCLGGELVLGGEGGGCVWMRNCRGRRRSGGVTLHECGCTVLGRFELSLRRLSRRLPPVFGVRRHLLQLCYKIFFITTRKIRTCLQLAGTTCSRVTGRRGGRVSDKRACFRAGSPLAHALTGPWKALPSLLPTRRVRCCRPPPRISAVR
jgi:hypothetical protein